MKYLNLLNEFNFKEIQKKKKKKRETINHITINYTVLVKKR